MKAKALQRLLPDDVLKIVALRKEDPRQELITPAK
jgi:hypothetical protein